MRYRVENLFPAQPQRRRFKMLRLAAALQRSIVRDGLFRLYAEKGGGAVGGWEEVYGGGGGGVTDVGRIKKE